MPMRQSLPLLAVLAVAGPGALHAQTPPPRPVEAAPSQSVTIRPLLGLADARASADRPYAAPFVPAPRPGDGSPTAVDYDLAPGGGLAASVGFVCDNDGRAPQTHGATALAGSEPGRLIGTTLRVGF